MIITGKNNILEVWPNLELFTHGGVSFTPYREHFRKLIPSDKMNYLETYNASEGFFGIQDELDRDDMLLMLDLGIFYEFIPMDQLDDPNPPVYTVGDVETGDELCHDHHHQRWIMALSDWRYGGFYLPVSTQDKNLRTNQILHQCFW